jgi:hypothetical protein
VRDRRVGTDVRPDGEQLTRNDGGSLHDRIVGTGVDPGADHASHWLNRSVAHANGCRLDGNRRRPAHDRVHRHAVGRDGRRVSWSSAYANGHRLIGNRRRPAHNRVHRHAVGRDG